MEIDLNKYNFSYVKLNASEPPKELTPKNKQYVLFGKKNDFPNYLIENYQKSSTHAAIVNGKINYISGKGLKVEDYQTVNDLAITKALIKSVNEYEDADDLNRKLATDLTLFGGFYCEILPNKKKEIGGLAHLEFQNIRRDKEDLDLWYYTADWNNKPEQNEDWKVFHTFKGTFEQGKNYLCEYRSYRAGEGFYSLPDYLSANNYIESEWRIANFQLNNIKNGFAAGFLVNMYNGQPTEEEKQYIERAFKEMFQGDENAGKVVLNWSNPDSKPAEIIPIPTNGQDDRFRLLDEQIKNALFIAHSVTNPMLFGVKTAGQLGGRNELIESYELFQNTYIEGKQLLLEKFWNDILNYKKINAKLEIVRTTPFGVEEKVNPVALSLGSLSPLVANKVLDSMTVPEIRGLIGLAGGIDDLQKSEFSKQKKDDKLVEHFSNCGFEEDELEVVYERGINAKNIEDAEKFAEVTAFENKVLGLLIGSPDLPPQEIAKALNVEVSKVMDAYKTLVAEGLVEIVDNQYKPTQEGIVEAPEDDVIVVYKYDKRPDAPKLKEGGRSREFCTIMMRLNRSYTIDDIKALRNGQGLDVFVSRGGWYTNPITKAHTPYCRHRWVQRLVRIKK